MQSIWRFHHLVQCINSNFSIISRRKRRRRMNWRRRRIARGYKKYEIVIILLLLAYIAIYIVVDIVKKKMMVMWQQQRYNTIEAAVSCCQAKPSQATPALTVARSAAELSTTAQHTTIELANPLLPARLSVCLSVRDNRPAEGEIKSIRLLVGRSVGRSVGADSCFAPIPSSRP